MSMELNVYRSQGDQLADNVVAVIQKESPGFWGSPGWREFVKNSDEPDHSWSPELLAFIEETSILPPWANLPVLSQSQRFFNEHRPFIYLCLGLYSLPYCYAAADGAKVLFHSKRLRDSPGKRLTETASFVLDICEEGAFQQKGRAFRSIQKVRLMHALNRFYLKDQPFWQSSWGLPINQEDMAGTNLAFSLIVLRGLRKLGVDVKKSQSADFLHLWKVVGFLMGIDEPLLMSNAKEAIGLENKIRQRHFRESMEGKTLTTSLSQYVADEMDAKKLPLPTLALMEHLLGPEVAGLLGVKSSGIEKAKVKALIGLTTMQQLIGIDFLWGNDQIDRVNL